ncbi:hypothetical protein GEMRC1_003071 [Eukaryota sp. GEM-RC1]
MRIHNIHVQHFKSIERLTLGPFNEESSIVLGANGTGKTNVLDAISFVLSDSPQNMRVTQLSEVLNRRSALGTNYCEVSLELINPHPKLPYNSSSYVLSAKMYNDKPTRIYKLNGKTISTNELKKFLTANSIDPSSSLMVIKQSAVTSLCSSKPELLAKYILSASGASQFQKASKDAHVELLKAEEAIVQVTNNVNDLNASIGAAEKATNAWVHRKELKAELESIQKRLSLHLNAENLNKIEKLDHELNDLRDQSSKVHEQIEQVNCRLKQAHAEFQSVHQQELDQTKTLSAIEDKISELTQRDSVLESELFKLKENVELEKKKKKDNQTSLTSLSTQLEEFEDHYQTVTNQIALLEKFLNDCATDGEAQPSTIDNLQARLRVVSRNSVRLHKEYEHARGRLAQRSLTQKELKQVTQTIEESDCASLEQNVAAYSAKLSDLKTRLSDDSESRIPSHLNQLIQLGLGTFGSLIEFRADVTNIDQFKRALEVIIRPILNVIITDTTNEATDIISSHQNHFKSLKVWPLDRFRPQKQIDFAAKLPASLLALCVEPSRLIQMIHSKFSHLMTTINNVLIVDCDSTAAEVVKHKVNAITLDGVWHSPSSVSYNSPNIQSNSINLFDYMDFAKMIHKRQTLVQEIDLLSNMHSKTVKELKHLEFLVQRKSVLAGELSALEDVSEPQCLKLRDEARELKNQEIALAKHIKHLQLTSKNSEFTVDSVMSQLSALRLERSEIFTKQQKISNNILERSERIFLNYSDSMQRINDQIEHVKAELSAQLVLKTESQSLLVQVSDQSHQIQTVSTQLQSELELLTQKREEIERKRTTIEEQLKKLRIVVETVESCSNTRLDEESYQQMVDREAHLRVELKTIEKVSENLKSISSIDREHQHKLLSSFQEQCEALHDAAAKLREGLQKYQSKIEEANQTVVSKVQETLQLLVPKLIPTKEAQLFVSDPVTLSNVHIKVKCTDDDCWSGLETLSGGQRTLLSSALLLALAKTSLSGFYLLDEIDGALDEANQALLGSHLKSLMTNTQLIAVSHNKVFQRYFDRQFIVKMSEDGTVLDQIIDK